MRSANASARASLQEYHAAAPQAISESQIPGADSLAGILLCDRGMRPLYTNAEALRILGYPISPGDVNSLGSLLAQKMRFAFPTDANLPALPQAREFLSGNRRYLCRFFALEPSLKGPSAPTLVLLMERTLQTAFGVSKIAKQFHLALREQEAVELLCDGLSSREIAQRMEISPNTVKAFLRLVMIKMGVSNGAGIIGKTLKS